MAETKDKLVTAESLKYVNDALYARILDIAASAAQSAPEFAQSLDWLEENGDENKIYILPNGNLAGCIVQLGSTNHANPADADWKEGYRLNSSGTVSAQAGFTVTNFIPAKRGDVIRVKGLDFAAASEYCMVWTYNNNKTKITRAVTGMKTSSSPAEGAKDVVSTESDGTQVYTVLQLGNGNQLATTAVDYIRICGTLTGSAADVVITVNEPIVESGAGETWVDLDVPYAHYALTDGDRTNIAQKVLDILDVSYIAVDNAINVGKYTLKYEDAAGVADIGEVTV